MSIDLKAKFDELDARRRFHIDGVDQAVEAMARLRELDRHLVEQGFHEALQLEHAVTSDPPLHELPEFAGDGPPPPAEPEPALRPPPDPVEAEPVPASSPTAAELAAAYAGVAGQLRGTQGRRFTPEQKAEAVRLADELDSDKAAAKQLGTTATSISNWRKAGHGKRPKSVATRGLAAGRGEEPAPTGPQVKCKVCKTSTSIEGAPNQVNRLAATQRHWKDSPDCGEAMRKRRA